MPLYKLLEKNCHWQWTEEYHHVLETCKSLLTSEAVLVHYDSTNCKPLKLSCDASQHGLGAILSHVLDGVEHPVAFASRTLNHAEVNYGQIEKEALALVYGVKKFHKYLYGWKFTMVTDHKPLLSILNAKSAVSSVVAARMQRWAMFLSAYQYDIEYKNSKSHANADCLSRFPAKADKELEDPVTVFQISYVELLIMTKDIALETSKDSVLMKVYNCH